MKQILPRPRRNMLPAAIAAGVLGIAASTSANAALYISFQINDAFNDSGVITCLDNAACDINPAVGTLSLAAGTQPIPGFLVNGSTHTSVKSAGPGGFNQLISGSSSVMYTSSNGSFFALAQVAVGDTDYVGPSTTFSSTASGTFANADGSVINLEFFNDPANSQGADTGPFDRPGNLVDNFQHVQAGDQPTSFSHNDSGPLAFPDGPLYGMTLGFTFSLADGGSLVSRGQALFKPTNSVPEPGSMLLLGSALLGLGATRRRKAK